MQRENPLHAFVVHDSPHREVLVRPRPLLHDYDTAEDLNALFFAFDDPSRHVHCVPHRKLWNFLLKMRLLYEFKNLVCHDRLRFTASKRVRFTRNPILYTYRLGWLRAALNTPATDPAGAVLCVPVAVRAATWRSRHDSRPAAHPEPPFPGIPG